MINQLLPKKNQFYDFFSQAADLSVEAAKVLQELVAQDTDRAPLARRLKEIEHQCDEVAHATMELLNKTFITPLDREDIHELILKLDDVVDLLVPIPDEDIQTEIVAEIQRRRSEARRLREAASREWEEAKARFEAEIIGEP